MTRLPMFDQPRTRLERAVEWVGVVAAAAGVHALVTWAVVYVAHGLFHRELPFWPLFVAIALGLALLVVAGRVLRGKP